MQTEANINTFFDHKAFSCKGDNLKKKHIKPTETNNNVVKFFINREKKTLNKHRKIKIYLYEFYLKTVTELVRKHSPDVSWTVIYPHPVLYTNTFEMKNKG